MKTPEIRTAYSKRKRAIIKFPKEEGRTKQAFRDETDINLIVRKYEQNGVIETQYMRQPTYADVSEYPDFTIQQQIKAAARSMYENLPQDVRDKHTLEELLENLEAADQPTEDIESEDSPLQTSEQSEAPEQSGDESA